MARAARDPAVRVRLSPSTDVVLYGPGHALLIQGSHTMMLSDRETRRLREELEEWDVARRGPETPSKPEEG